MHLRKLADDGEADSETAFTACDGAFTLREKLEHLRQALGIDADAAIPHRHADLTILRRGAQGDVPARRRVFSRVAEQIEDDLLDPRRVGIDPQFPAGILAGEQVLAVLEQRADGFNRAVQDRGHIKGFTAQANLARIDP
jgi:hypothetical protein